MKYLLIALIAFTTIQCSPKLSPDTGWARQRWVVVEMKGVPVQQSGGRKDAFLNFEINEKRFNGNGGCNQINGNYSVNKSDINFTDVTSTKMMCQDMAFESTFLTVLSTVDRYEINGADMYLKKKNEILLILRSM